MSLLPIVVTLAALHPADPPAAFPTSFTKPRADGRDIIEPAAASGLPTKAPAFEPGSSLAQAERIEPTQGDIVVTARPRRSPSDPLAGINAKSFGATQAIDDAVVGPLAHGYVRALPAPVRLGVRNFLENLHEPDVFVNYVLQLKPGKAAETLGRFVLNSTIGMAGVMDIAKRRPFSLPRRPNGFADTFGYYGIRAGPFLFLPVLGATTPRDIVGLVLDRALLPFVVGRPFNRLAYSVPTGVLHTLDRRAGFDDELQAVRAAGDPYVARRDLYLRRREAEIDRLHGREPKSDPPAGVTGPAPGHRPGEPATHPPN